MSKKFLFFSILILSIKLLSAQDISYFFKILPASYTKELSPKTKDLILKGNDYYPADNDKDQIAVYRLEELDTIKNFLRIEMRFETGQNGFWVFELRSFKIKSGNSIVVFSDFGGLKHNFYQNDLTVFSFAKNIGLTKISSLGLLTKVSVKDFLKPDSPDSIIKKIESYSDVSYRLGYLGDNVTLNLFEEVLPGEFDNWLLGDTIEFVWNGNRFIKQKPAFAN